MAIVGALYRRPKSAARNPHQIESQWPSSGLCTGDPRITQKLKYRYYLNGHRRGFVQATAEKSRLFCAKRISMAIVGALYRRRVEIQLLCFAGRSHWPLPGLCTGDLARKRRGHLRITLNLNGHRRGFVPATWLVYLASGAGQISMAIVGALYWRLAVQLLRAVVATLISMAIVGALYQRLLKTMNALLHAMQSQWPSSGLRTGGILT